MSPHVASGHSDLKRLVAELQALSDRNRLELVELIGTQAQAQTLFTVAEMAEKIQISSALASYHLGIAKKAGLVKSLARGQFSLTIRGEWWMNTIDSRRDLVQEVANETSLSVEVVAALDQI